MAGDGALTYELAQHCAFILHYSALENNEMDTTGLGLRFQALPVSRPLLIFNHNAKAAGGSVLAVLRDAFECEIKKHTDGNYSGNNPAGDDEDCFLNVKEGSSVDYKERQRGFVIGSVREPCSHYVSIWSFHSRGKGGKGSYIEGLMGQDPPFYNSTEDVDRFREYVRDPSIVGWVTRQLVNSYSDTLPGGQEGVEVDCWVFADDFQNSLLGCLRAFEHQGGRINWNATILSDLVRLSEGGERKYSTPAVDEVKKVKKNDPFGNPQLDHHSPCESYYDAETSSVIENGPDSVIYNAFGYTGCCKGRVSRPGLVAHSERLSLDAHINKSFGSEVLLPTFLFAVAFALGATWWSAKSARSDSIGGCDHLVPQPPGNTANC